MKTYVMGRAVTMVVAVLAFSTGSAVTRTWSGGGDGKTWSNPANWGGTVPVLGDTAQFNTDATVEGEIVLAANPDAPTAKQVTINVASGKKVYLKGLISGVGGICKDNTGQLYIDNADNTYTGPTTLKGGGGSTTHVNKLAGIGQSSSLGMPTGDAATLLFQGSGRLDLDTAGTVSLDRPIDNSGGGGYICGVSGCTINLVGPLTGGINSRNAGTINVHSNVLGGVGRTDGGTIVLLGPANKLTSVANSQGTIKINNFGRCDDGKVCGITLGQTGSGSYGTVIYTGTVDENVSANITVSRAGSLQNASAGTCLRLTGTISDNYDVSLLQVKTTGDIVLDGGFSSRVKLLKDGGAGELVLNGANASTKEMGVSAGTLRLNGSVANLAGASLTVSSGATLAGTGTVSVATTVSTSSSIAPGGSKDGAPGTLVFREKTLTLAAGSRLKIRVGSETNDVVDAATVSVGGAVSVDVTPYGAEQIPAGSYRIMRWTSCPTQNFVLGSDVPEGTRLSADATGLTLTVPADQVILVWAGDGSGNVWNKTAANWAGGQVFQDGAIVTFDDNGNADLPINISESVEPQQVKVVSEEKNYTFAGSGGIGGETSLLKTGASTLTVDTVNDYSGTTLVQGGTLRLNGTLNGSTVIVSNGGILDEGESGVIAGAGVGVTLGCGTNVLRGANTYSGQTIINPHDSTMSSFVRVYNAAAFGNGTEVLGYGNSGSTLCAIQLMPNVFVEGKTLVCGNDVGNRFGISLNSATADGGWYGDIVGEDGSQSGCMLYLTSSSDNAQNRTLIIGKDASNTIAGKFGGVNLRGWTGTTRINSRINLPNSDIIRNDQGTVILAAAGNSFKSLNNAQGTVRMGVQGAWCPTAVLSLGKNENSSFCTFDMDGFDQTVNGIVEAYVFASYVNNRRTVMTSDGKPATLTLTNTTDCVFGSPDTTTVMSGPISLVKLGSAKQTFGAATTFTGTVDVREGTLALAAANAFGEVSEVTVRGGELQLAASDAINPKTDLRVPNGSTGVIRLNENVTATVHKLYVNDYPVEPGQYGSSECVGVKHLPFLAGKGVLTVRRGQGLMVIVR